MCGAHGATRTLTACAATPSRWCVYQFHHVGKTRGFYLNSSPVFATQHSHSLRQDPVSSQRTPRVATRARRVPLRVYFGISPPFVAGVAGAGFAVGGTSAGAGMLLSIVPLASPFASPFGAIVPITPPLSLVTGVRSAVDV